MDSAKIIRTVVLTLVFLSFFGLTMFSNEYFDYLFLSILVFMSLPVLKHKTPYTLIIKLYVLFVLLSCFYSWFFNGQSIISVIGHSYDYFALLFFFCLLSQNITFDEAEKALEKIALCFCVCYIFQWIIYPVVLFDCVLVDLDVNSFQYRARMPGSICCYFLLMYSVNRFVLDKNIKYLFWGILASMPIIIMGFRSLIAITLVAIFLMMPFVVGMSKKIILYAFLVIVALFFATTTSVVQDKIEEMMRRQESNQTFDNEDYIRFLSFDYYWNQQFTKPYEKVIGGGNPVDKSSRYCKSIDTARMGFGFFWRDLGIIGLSMIIGLPAVLLLTFMYFRCMWKCREPQLQYIRFALFIVFFSSIFTSAELYRTGNILLLSLFLYLEYRYHYEQNMLFPQEKTTIIEAGNSNTIDVLE